jgi:predicted metalloprotease with PDZ domain
VPFGKVLSLAGASVAVLVGEKMPRKATHDDWVLVHELIHLGFPSFRGEGRWLGEGIATYYEPILRARAGWLGEKELWTTFAREMRNGLPQRGSHAPIALASRDDIDGIYWGGALYALLADVGLRKAGSSLDQVLRAMLAKGGDATHVWTVDDVMRAGDDASHTHVMSDLFKKHVVGDHATPMDLDGTLGLLGVEVRARGQAAHAEDVVLRDDRPLSAVRKAIVHR